METLLKEEFFHFGTDKIYAELWQELFMLDPKHNYTKPIGGLWTSHQNDEFLSEWLWYLENVKANIFEYLVHNKKSSLVKFKENSKLLSIKTPEDYKNLKQSGFIITLDNPICLYGTLDYTYIHEIPDYDKIKKYYDVMYVDNFVKDCFRQFAVRSMVALNVDSIEYYKPLIVDYLSHEIIKIGDKKEIIKPTKEYFNFLLYVKELIYEVLKNNQTNNSTQIENLKEMIIKELMDNFNIDSLKIPKDIDKYKFMYTAVTNTYNTEYKKILHY